MDADRTDPAIDAGPKCVHSFGPATASVDPIQWIPRKMCRIEKVRWVETGAQLRHNQWRREYARPMRKRMKRLSAMRRQGKIPTYFVGVDVAPNGDFACAVVAHKEGDVTVVDSVMRRQCKGG